MLTADKPLPRREWICSGFEKAGRAADIGN